MVKPPIFLGETPLFTVLNNLTDPFGVPRTATGPQGPASSGHRLQVVRRDPTGVALWTERKSLEGHLDLARCEVLRVKPFQPPPKKGTTDF